MNGILINGNFLCRNLTGVERLAIETCRELDALIGEGDTYAILVPANARFVPEYKHIRIIRSESSIKRFPFWDMGTFARACRRFRMTALSFSNTAPLGKTCGLAYIHDIYAKDFPQDFTSFRDRLICLYDRLQFLNIAHCARHILTVSQFTKERLEEAYGVPAEKVTVTGSAWSHFAGIAPDSSIFSRFPMLEEKPFYFTLGSLSKRKNLAWIARYAEEHPDECFAISGKAISGLVPEELGQLSALPNVVLLGYVSDGEVKALMGRCRAFVFPSYYEGFGLPPLEALSAGAPVVLAKAASLPEIYGAAAHYIDPYRTDVSIPALLEEPAAPPQPLLETFTYAKLARRLYDTIRALPD